jgi:hypothetical protein
MLNTEATETIPDWVTKTPAECEYSLTMYEPGGSSEQEVWLSRDEYEYLKQCLAARRGYGEAKAIV